MNKDVASAQRGVDQGGEFATSAQTHKRGGDCSTGHNRLLALLTAGGQPTTAAASPPLSVFQTRLKTGTTALCSCILSIGTRTAYTFIVPMEHVENLVKIYHTRPKPAYGRQGLDWIVGP